MYKTLLSNPERHLCVIKHFYDIWVIKHFYKTLSTISGFFNTFIRLCTIRGINTYKKWAQSLGYKTCLSTYARSLGYKNTWMIDLPA
jgi:hypothetical protein